MLKLTGKYDEVIEAIPYGVKIVVRHERRGRVSVLVGRLGANEKDKAYQPPKESEKRETGAA